jgi:hypothetical protein
VNPNTEGMRRQTGEKRSLTVEIRNGSTFKTFIFPRIHNITAEEPTCANKTVVATGSRFSTALFKINIVLETVM